MYDNPTTVDFENLEGLNSSCGSLQGTIEASFAQLKNAIGTPDFEGIGDKITTQFVVRARFGDMNDNDYDGITFTLYDWYFSRDLNDDYVTTTWNVGGDSYQSVEAANLLVEIMNKDDNYLENIVDNIIDISETNLMLPVYS